MISSAIWLAGLVMEVVLIARAVQGRFLSRYPLFYAYMCAVFVRDLALFAIFHRFPNLYARAYWYSQFLLVLLGCGVVWEIYRCALRHYPGVVRMAQNVIPFLFVLSFTRVIAKMWESPRWLPGATTLETERDLRFVQAMLLAGLVTLSLYYAVPVGKNVRGMIAGFGFFLATSLVHLTARHNFGEAFQAAWQYIQPVTYLVSLVIWLLALWNYAPAPAVSRDSRLELGYQALLAGTRRRFNATRTRLAKAMRP
jgi:hypothetical protein